MRKAEVGLRAESEFAVASEAPSPGLSFLDGGVEEGGGQQKGGGECEGGGEFFAIHLQNLFNCGWIRTKTPRRGIEPRFSDLKSDVLTVERSRLTGIISLPSYLIQSPFPTILLETLSTPKCAFRKYPSHFVAEVALQSVYYCMIRQLESHRVTKKLPPQNYKQMLRLKAINQDRRSALNCISNKINHQKRLRPDISEKFLMILPDKSKNLRDNVGVPLKSMLRSQVQLSTFIDYDILKQVKRGTPRQGCGMDKRRDKVRSFSQNNNLSNRLQYAKNMRSQFQKASKNLDFQDTLPKSKHLPESAKNQAAEQTQIVDTQYFKNALHTFSRLKADRVSAEIDDEKRVRYNDIPMVEFLYENHSRCKSLSSSLQRKLESMCRGQALGQAGLRA